MTLLATLPNVLAPNLVIPIHGATQLISNLSRLALMAFGGVAAGCTIFARCLDRRGFGRILQAVFRRAFTLAIGRIYIAGDVDAVGAALGRIV